MSEAENIQVGGKSLDEWFNARFEEKMAERAAEKTPLLSMLVSKGTLDWAYPPFILASTAAALGWNVSVFFTFYGLGLLKKDLQLDLSALGNPAMPMKMPFGPEWFRGVQWNMPNLIQANVPGFEKLASGLMRETMRQKGVATIDDLRDACLDMDVELIPCQMTVDLFDWKKEDFIDGISDWAGAATYLSKARGA
ncbi:DsrE/DsrF/DrsH-like family protein, partial [Gammaproteobacteria bacterium]|nr:DsrE/DsrF/DrsH-like family protein [Gammaproteobacteria bacterium]